MNKYRITAHHVVFFIFIVSNVGGFLTPIGDPPLFLGYLKGIPFWWVARFGWPAWAVAVSILLAMFYVVDTLNYRRAPKEVQEGKTAESRWRFDGLLNLAFLAVILGAVFLQHPPFVRELLMVGAAVGSYYTTSKSVHAANHFNFHPIREVAILFAGIFATMMPALDWLQANAGRMGTPGTTFFFWGSGTLSSVLDNAPTYLSFFKALIGTSITPEALAQVQGLIETGGAGSGSAGEAVRNTFAALQRYLPAAVASRVVAVDQIEVAYLLGNPSLARYVLAVSAGAVFFGANTYIGNGPNFMVKAIADQARVHTPSFVGYIVKFTIPFMLPMLLCVWWIFFRG